MNFRRFIVSNVNILLLLSLPILFLFYHLASSTDHQNFISGSISHDTVPVEKLKEIIKCNNQSLNSEVIQNGNYWMLKNYIKAGHGNLNCYEMVTYTTHAEFTFLDNLGSLVERWRAPISLALFAPGTDFELALHSIKYLHNCVPQNELIREFVTFHIFFEFYDFPKTSMNFNNQFYLKYANCSTDPPYMTVNSKDTYRMQKNLTYPVNIARNLARDAALTHYVLPSDIELYPNPGLAIDFVQMIARNHEKSPVQSKLPRVYPIAIFEIEKDIPMPIDKNDLIELLTSGKAIPFHKYVCSYCHSIPNYTHWMNISEKTELDVFTVAKRQGHFANWEPIFIGTRYEPRYDERLSWEGLKDKMTQGYALCALNYEFHILNNAFIIHKPGIKRGSTSNNRRKHIYETNQIISRYIHPELKAMFGDKKGCVV